MPPFGVSQPGARIHDRDESLIRRVRLNQRCIRDQMTGKIRPPAAAFEPRLPETGRKANERYLSVNVLSSLMQAGETRDWRCDHSQFYAVILAAGIYHDLDLPTTWEPTRCSDPEKANPHHGGIWGVVELCRSDADGYENAITELAAGSEVLPECMTPRLRVG